MHRIGKRAERRVESAYINDLKRVAGKTRILYRIADAALEHPDEPVRQVDFPVANEQTLRDLVAEYKAQGEAYRQILPAPLLFVLWRIPAKSHTCCYDPIKSMTTRCTARSTSAAAKR